MDRVIFLALEAILMFKAIKHFLLWCNYKCSEMQNIYSHKAIGQRQNKEGTTIIMYTILGKRDVYEISINDLMDNKRLLERFHPCQAAKFGVISLGDVLFTLPQHQREQRYHNIKTQILTPHVTNSNHKTTQ
jgi:hypothetical protein